ncbi:ribonuclease H-like domain-containing protein [Tanacetum coccineum]
MELKSINSSPTTKLPILKLGKYEMWVIRIKQYFQIQDYALWEVKENSDSWVSVSQTSQENGITVTKMSTPATAEEKTNKKNDVKARGLLLVALPNEHQLTFSQYPDAKSMFAAIENKLKFVIASLSVNTAPAHKFTLQSVSGNIFLSLLSVESKKYYQRTSRRLSVMGKPQHDDKGFVDSGCSRHMTGNIAYLSDFKQFDGGYVAFGGGAYGGKITGKRTLKTDNLDFKDVYFVNELKFNLFSVSQMCDKKNYVLFTDTECLVLSPNFKLPDENQILLKIPRKDNMYSFDMKNIVPKESLTCLVAKATLDESMLWHRRLGHINFKNINKLVKDNLVLEGKQSRLHCDAILEDTSYFDSPTKDVENGEPKTTDDAQKQVEDGLNNENNEQERFTDDSSTKDVDAVGQQVNTFSTDVNTGSLKFNAVGPSVSTASPNEEDNTEEESEVDLGNITNSY